MSYENPDSNEDTLSVLEEVGVSLDDIIESSDRATDHRKFYGVHVSRLMFDEDEQLFCIQHPYEQDYVLPVTRTTVDIGKTDIGREVLVSFNGGHLLQPVITGKVRPIMPAEEHADPKSSSVHEQDSMIFRADREIVLQCGKSSITLTKAGKILIRGAYILSRSSGVNKIKGGSIQLN